MLPDGLGRVPSSPPPPPPPRVLPYALVIPPTMFAILFSRCCTDCVPSRPEPALDPSGLSESMSRAPSAAGGSQPARSDRRPASPALASLAGASGRRKRAATVDEARGPSTRVIRSAWCCEGCAVNGEAPNEFTDKSPYAHFDKVVIAKGTQEKPKGTFCQKCFYVWSVGGSKRRSMAGTSRTLCGSVTAVSHWLGHGSTVSPCGLKPTMPASE